MSKTEKTTILGKKKKVNLAFTLEMWSIVSKLYPIILKWVVQFMDRHSLTFLKFNWVCIWYAYQSFLTKARERAVHTVLGMKWLNETLVSCHSSVGGKCLMMLLWEWYDYTGNDMVLHRKWRQCHISAQSLKLQSQPGR